jgi:hypothetical protein
LSPAGRPVRIVARWISPSNTATRTAPRTTTYLVRTEVASLRMRPQKSRKAQIRAG